jgi:alpha/beta hydrolase family protein
MKCNNRRTISAASFKLSRVSIACALACTGAVVTSGADARITRLQITTHESPTFGGFSWPGVGQYEKIAGKAFGELDPADPKNAVIVDLSLAPRNAGGKVEYSFDFYMLKPIDLSKGNHKMLYEPPNRGGKTISALNRGVGGNDPGSVTNATTLANSFLMPQGYSISFSGWDLAAGTNSANFNTTITLPIAKNPDGSSITGPSFEYIVSPGSAYALTYPAATLDQSKATLTHRVHLDDVPVPVPASGWAYNADGTSIHLASGNFIANDIYEFSYTAKDPAVTGVGFAAIRDWNAFLRYETKDDAGTPNPLAGDITRIYTEISSQPGRTLNDFRYFGFNQAENGKQVFDGLMQWIAAGDGISMNYRWAQPGRTERNRQDHLFNEARFPFANVTTTDPITGKTESRYTKCTATSTCPFAVEIYTGNEYWVKAASLMSTNPQGTADLPDSPFTRLYFMSSMQHGTGSATSRGNCQQFQNPLDSSPVQRALFIALDKWVTEGTLPPPSQVPKLADGTLQPPLPQDGMGFPHIPGVTYTGLKTTRYLFNYGSDFRNTGIPTINPPSGSAPYQDNPAWGPIYPSFIPKTDSDGNDIAGVRLPRVTVPLATYTGWALRSGAQANDGCESSGQYIPFPATKAARLASGDPRPSAQERYGSYGTYSLAFAMAVKKMVANRTLLQEDAVSVLNDGLTLGASVLPLLPAPN